VTAVESAGPLTPQHRLDVIDRLAGAINEQLVEQTLPVVCLLLHSVIDDPTQGVLVDAEVAHEASYM
jgi:hypothetical protein